MAERRRSARFALTLPMDSHVCLLQDLRIEHTGEDNVTVMSVVPGVRGEEMTLRIGPSDAVQMTVRVRTVASEPVLVEGHVRHRIFLAMTGAIALSSGEGARTNSWRAGDHSTAVFVRRYPASVLNLGRGGCLLDLGVRLSPGSAGTIQRVDGTSGSEPIRVATVTERRSGTTRYLTGVEFLALGTPSSYSLRAMADRIECGAGWPSLAPHGEESGHGLTRPAVGALDLLAIVCADHGNQSPLRATMRTPEFQQKAGRALALVEGKSTPAER